MLAPALIEALQRDLGCKIAADASSVSGGSIHAAARVATNQGAVFVKHGPASVAEQFAAECDGVQALSQTKTIRTPGVLACGATDTHAYAVFEWIEFAADTQASDVLLGEQLAALHRTRGSHFGWHRDNYIGATPQPNTPSAHWSEFWRERRLRYQLDRARTNGASTRLIELGEQLLTCMDDMFDNHTPEPSLIHGDLWSGNRATDGHGQPVIFDPAVYYGDREAELAMMQLFGGFSRHVQAAYEAVWPLPPGADTRLLLYQLYHVLNHFNLFGGSYHAQAERLLQQLLATVRA